MSSSFLKDMLSSSYGMYMWMICCWIGPMLSRISSELSISELDGVRAASKVLRLRWIQGDLMFSRPVVEDRSVGIVMSSK